MRQFLPHIYANWQISDNWSILFSEGLSIFSVSSIYGFVDEMDKKSDFKREMHKIYPESYK